MDIKCLTAVVTQVVNKKEIVVLTTKSPDAIESFPVKIVPIPQMECVNSVKTELQGNSVLNAHQDTTFSIVLVLVPVLKISQPMEISLVGNKRDVVLKTVMNVRSQIKLSVEPARKELSYRKDNVLRDVLKDIELIEFPGVVWKPLFLLGIGFILP